MGAPIIYGDWTTDLRPEAPEVPAFPVNGLNANVLLGISPVRCVISSTPLLSLDTTTVTLLRSDIYYVIAPGDIAIVGGTDNTIFDITQMNFNIDGSPWIYVNGDSFFVKCIGVPLAFGLNSNIVEIGRDILIRFGGAVLGDFDVSWNTIAGKSLPVEDGIFGIKTRVWLQEAVNAMEYVLSLFEQVRIEAFVDKNNKFKLTTLHFSDFVAAPAFTLTNPRLVRGTLKPEIDERNNWNRAKADYSLSQVTGEAKFSTPIFKNDIAIAQSGRQISKLVSFPNLVDEVDVINQLTEMIKLASSYGEFLVFDVTWFGQQLDISDEIDISNINIGGLNFTILGTTTRPTAKIREIGYEKTGRIRIKAWNFQMIPFPGNEKPFVPGITGGSTAVITQE